MKIAVMIAAILAGIAAGAAVGLMTSTHMSAPYAVMAGWN